MADVLDNVQSTMERELAQVLMSQKNKNPKVYSGRCKNCNDEIAITVEFCDHECQEDYKKRTLNKTGW